MKASEVIKACDLKSTKQVADYNGVSSRCVQYAFKDNKAKFCEFVMNAIRKDNAERVENAEAVLGSILNDS